MSKHGQDSLTLALLLLAFVLTLVWIWRILVNPRSDQRARALASMTLAAYCVGVPVVLYVTGALPELWHILIYPFR